MSSFFSFLSRESLESSFSTLWRRFPLQAVIIVFITGVLLYVVNSESTDLTYAKLIFTGVVTLFVSIGMSLYSESRKENSIVKWLPFLSLFYGVFFYYTVGIREDMGIQSITYFLLHLVGFVSLAFFAPYLSRILEGEEGSIEYTNYFSRIAWMFLMSVIVGVSLLFLGFIAIMAVTELFDLTGYNWIEKLYSNWATIALSLFAPIYGLLHIPHEKDVEKKTFEVNRFFAFLIKFVAVPFIYIYFAILYAYSVKVLANFSDWPKGIVSWLVIGFSSFGYLSYIFSRAYEENSLVSLFRRYFPYVVVPQIAMLGYAIYLRIAQYDLTMNRYFVVIFGVWLLGISLYYIASKRKSLSIIPASLSVISLCISLGPWSVFTYPQLRQEARLIGNLETAKILQNGKITPLKSERDISKELSTEIAAGIEYLCSFDNCERIKGIFPDQTKKAETKSREDWEKWNKENTGAIYPGVSEWEVSSAITTELKVQRYPYDETTQDFPEPEFLSYSIDYQKGQYPLDVSGYDTLVQVIAETESKIASPEMAYPYITIDSATQKVTLNTASGTTRGYTLSLSEKLLNSATLSNVTKEDLTFTLSDNKYEIRLVLQSLSLKNPRYKKPDKSSDKITAYIGGTYGLALIKEKK